MDNNSTISLKDLFTLFMSHIWVLIISLAVGCGGAYAYTYYTMSPEYSSHISMYVQTYTGIKNDYTQDYNDISKSKQLINTYIAVLKDDAVMESVADSISQQFDESVISENFVVSGGKIRPSSLASKISITTVTDTSAVNIVAQTKNAELSASICNELCSQANKFTKRAIGVGEIKSIDTAKVYPNPVGPNKIKNTALGGIAALGLAAFLIFLLDFFDNTIKESEYLSKKYKKAILGEILESDIPKKKKKDNSDDHMSLLHDNVSFDIVESYKAMRTNIMFAVSTSDNKAFVVSSSNPDEGKSTTASNIAISFADGGHKTLLIDADMRKPTQHRIFDLKNEVGLSSVLSKMKESNECVQKTVLPKLSVLTSGPIPPNPSELLSSERTASVIQELSSVYDVIIIDSPPVNVVSDALNLSPYVSGLLTIVRSRYTSTEDIKELVGKADLAHMNMLGFVITRIKKKSSGKYYKRYGKYSYEKYGYGYGEKPDKNKKSGKEDSSKK